MKPVVKQKYVKSTYYFFAFVAYASLVDECFVSQTAQWFPSKVSDNTPPACSLRAARHHLIFVSLNMHEFQQSDGFSREPQTFLCKSLWSSKQHVILFFWSVEFSGTKLCKASALTENKDPNEDVTQDP